LPLIEIGVQAERSVDLIAVQPRRISLMKNDMQIQHDVVAALDCEQKVITSTIGVEVHHGVVKLAGCVSDSEIREDAKRAAGRVDGVTTVLMDIDVTRAGARTMETQKMI
jgi:osmotically-inducible protein OsmY